MTEICPLCNGLYNITVTCPSCGESLENAGTLQEMLGPYSPHEENNELHEAMGCVHQMYCPACRVQYSYSATGDNRGLLGLVH